jgi:P-type Ca2+ transporter type 2C
MPNWHAMTADAVLHYVKTSSQGLSVREVQQRLAEHGPNVLTEGTRRGQLRMALGQFRDVMILVLLVAAVISGLIGEATDTIAIIAIVILNAVIGFMQEYRAERAMEALRTMAAPNARVIRDGNVAAIPA